MVSGVMDYQFISVMIYSKPGNGEGWLWTGGNIFVLILWLNLGLVLGVLREPNELNDNDEDLKSIQQANEWSNLIRD